MGIYRWACGQLDPGDLDFVDARLRALRPERRRPPSDERRLARGHGGLAAVGLVVDDAAALAQRAGCGGVRRSPLAGRVGGLGDRAERRSQRPVLRARARRVRDLCPPALFDRPVPDGGAVVRAGNDGQADLGDISLPALAVGLLAAGARRGQKAAIVDRVPPCGATTGRGFVARPRPAGEAPAAGAFGRHLRRSRLHSRRHHGGDGALLARLAAGKLPGVLRLLSGQALLSRRSCRALSPGESLADLAGRRGLAAAAGHHRGRFLLAAKTPLPVGRLALVSWE